MRLALTEDLVSKTHENEVPSSKSTCNSEVSGSLLYSFKHLTTLPTSSGHSITSSDIFQLSALTVVDIGWRVIITLIVCRLIVVMIEVWRSASYFHQVSFRLKNTEPPR